MRDFLRRLVERWPFLRGQTRLTLLLRPLLLVQTETIAPIGQILFPFQPYQWNFFFGVYESETKLLLTALLEAGETFLDIGANVGYFSAIAANLVGQTGQVIALEPEPVHFGRLKRLAEINRSFQINVLQAAVSDQCGRMSFCICEHPGWHSLIADFPQAPIKEVIEVNTWSLDELLMNRGLNHAGAVKLAKVDVEGAEHLVFFGASRAISQHWVQAFYVEITPSELSFEIFAKLLAAGYEGFYWHSNARTWVPHHANEMLSSQENILWLSNRNPQLKVLLSLGGK